jgi:putative hydrolase of the HAD superfamily
MKYSTVIFDLWGTLVPSLSSSGNISEYMVVLEQMAASLSVPLDDFNRVWFETARERSVGAIATIEANFEHICKELGVRAGDDGISRATQLRFDVVRRIMQPRSDAVEVLSQLKSRGFRIGLISNCSPDTPIVWQETPFPPFFEVTVFSSSAGMMKPDPRIYHLAIKQLEVCPEDCLYVGDGASQELPGAAQAGMNPVLIRAREDESIDSVYQIDTTGWHGPRVSSLTEVLALVE